MHTLGMLAKAALAALLVALILPSTARADCCICTDCPGGAVACADVGDCDTSGCDLRCQDLGCAENSLSSSSCRFESVCANTAPASVPLLNLVIALALIGIGVYHLRRRGVPPPLRAVGAVLVILGSVATVYAAMGLRATGTWQSAVSDANGVWSANLSVHDAAGSASGTVSLGGFESAETGSFEGTISHETVSGTLRDDAGNSLGTVEGTIAEGTVSGRYTAESGEVGTFDLQRAP